MANDSNQGIVALLTDFGTRDHFVASMKGAVLAIAPGTAIIDISHEVSPQDVRSAGFLVWASSRDLPEGTVFVCVVDPGVGSDRRRIVARAAGQMFVAPDNGLLSLIFGEEECEVFELDAGANLGRGISGTFDGRDFFAPVGARLASGTLPEEIGRPIVDPVREPALSIPGPAEEPAEGTVLHIDRFGNLITNLRPEHLRGSDCLRVRGKDVEERRRFFDEGPAGGLFLIEGSSGLVEICSNRGSAAEITGASPGDTVSLSRQKAV